MITSGLTHKGHVRKKNEDRFVIKDFDNGNRVLLAVIDGLGGQPGGEYAAELAEEILAAYEPTDEPVPAQLLALINRANGTILRVAEEDPSKAYMGCTITAALADREKVYWVHVGDCRLYHFRNRKLLQVTTDQNMAQFLVEEGQLTPEEAQKSPMQRMLDQCVGNPYCEPVTGEFAVEAGDAIYCFTDGIHDELEQDTMLAAIAADLPLADKIRVLVDSALQAGGRDNCTAVAAEL